MESLPPTYWYNLATKGDVRALKEWTQAEFTSFRGEMKQMFAQQTRTLMFMLMGFAVTIWGSILAIGLSCPAKRSVYWAASRSAKMSVAISNAFMAAGKPA